MVHMQRAVQERGIQGADYSYAECMEMIARCILDTGGDEKIGQAPRAQRHDTGQAAERHGSVGGAHMSSASGAGVAGVTEVIGP